MRALILEKARAEGAGKKKRRRGLRATAAGKIFKTQWEGLTKKKSYKILLRARAHSKVWMRKRAGRMTFPHIISHTKVCARWFWKKRAPKVRGATRVKKRRGGLRAAGAGKISKTQWEGLTRKKSYKILIFFHFNFFLIFFVSQLSLNDVSALSINYNYKSKKNFENFSCFFWGDGSAPR